MENAHLRMGKLKFVRQTRDTITEVSLHMDRLVAEKPAEKPAEPHSAVQIHLISVFGGDKEVGAIAAAIADEDALAVDQCEQRVIFALADAFAGMELGAQLTDDDVAGDNFFAAETFDAAALTVRIATVAAGALTFFMCHGGSTFELNRKRTTRRCGEKRSIK